MEILKNKPNKKTQMDNTNNTILLPVGTILHGTYKIERYLSSGGFGNTYVVTNVQFGETRAIKEFYLPT